MNTGNLVINASVISWKNLYPWLRPHYEKTRHGRASSNQLARTKSTFKDILLLPPYLDKVSASVCPAFRAPDLKPEGEGTVEYAVQQSTAWRENVLRAAFSSQLVPQDPDDEPASVLLERIRAEREARGAVKKPRGRKAKEPA